MSSESQDLIQLINTAIIKTKEKKINSSYENRLATICKKPALHALASSIADLSEKEDISRDQAAIQIVETIRELSSIWGDYIMIEGLNNLKEFLKTNKTDEDNV